MREQAGQWIGVLGGMAAGWVALKLRRVAMRVDRIVDRAIDRGLDEIEDRLLPEEGQAAG